MVSLSDNCIPFNLVTMWHSKTKNLHFGPELWFFGILILLSPAFTPFNTQSPSLLQTSESLAPVCLGHITSRNCPKSLFLLPPLPWSFLLLSRRQVAIIPSGDENSHCSPLSHSNNIMCLIRRWQRKREWGLTSWAITGSVPLVLNYFLFFSHYFEFIECITARQSQPTCFYCK